jgi:hypothetical protein
MWAQLCADRRVKFTFETFLGVWDRLRHRRQSETPAVSRWYDICLLRRGIKFRSGRHTTILPTTCHTQRNIPASGDFACHTALFSFSRPPIRLMFHARPRLFALADAMGHQTDQKSRLAKLLYIRTKLPICESIYSDAIRQHRAYFGHCRQWRFSA